MKVMRQSSIVGHKTSDHDKPSIEEAKQSKRLRTNHSVNSLDSVVSASNESNKKSRKNLTISASAKKLDAHSLRQKNTIQYLTALQFSAYEKELKKKINDSNA